MQNLIKSILFKSRKQIYMGKRPFHCYQIKLIKNISGSKQDCLSLQKNSS